MYEIWRYNRPIEEISSDEFIARQVDQGEIYPYRNYLIRRNWPEAREYQYHYSHEDFDGPEDKRRGDAKTIGECKAAIDELEENKE